MSARATLILTADPESRALDERAAAIVRPLVPPVVDPDERWLCPGGAVEWLLTPAGPCDLFRLREAACRALSGRPIDVNALPAGPGSRIRRLLVSDMDSTLIEQEIIDELAVLTEQGAEIAALTLKTMRGDIGFQESLRHRVSILRGLRRQDLDAVSSRLTLMPGARRLVATMKDHGARTVLVSGGFTEFTGLIASRLGMDAHYGNGLDMVDGELTGRVREPILDGAGKRDVLLTLTRELGLRLDETIAVGDGANDLPMLEAAGLGVAFRAKPAVRDRMWARPDGAVIDHAGLDALLALQGIAI